VTGLATNFTRNAVCNDCHNGAIDGSDGGPSHGDGYISVTVGNYPNNNRAKGSTYSVCSNAACHGNGPIALGFKSATWGTTNAAGCNFCHDAVPTTGSHSIHIAGGANYSFGCAECHGHNGSGPTHNDGTLNVVTVGFNGSKQCTASDCHSNGKAVVAYTTSPAWGGTFVGDRCAGCHGNWPTGDAHAAHQVGIHYDDVATGSIGKIVAAAAPTINAGHGNSTYSTTVSCNMCHNLTVQVSYNDLASTCSTALCHGTGGTTKGSLTTASVSKVYHVNRTREVSFANATIRSKAQLRDDITTVPELNNNWTRTNGYKAGLTSHDASKATLLATATYASGTGTCSTVVCHNGNSIVWTSGTITCDKCHTALP
jgi:predicted CxxxxCH...CXXCH cytochrome family protein